MALGIVDVIIAIFIILGAVIGFKNGAIKEGTKFIGLFIVIVLSFILKDKLMVMMYMNLPFFDFFGFIRGVSAINILFYQLLSFLIVFIALMFILKVVIVLTGLVELLLKMTIFLSLPSKIIGAVVGAVEYYTYVFIALLVLNLPVLNLTFVNNSKFGNDILNNTPILSGLVNDTVKVYGEVWDIVKNKDNKSNKEINTLVLVTLLDNNLITLDSAKELVRANKIILEDDSVLDEYSTNSNLYNELKNKYLS